MYKKIVFIFLLVVSSLQVWAQQTQDSIQVKSSIPKKDVFLLRWAPLSLFEPHTPSARISGEYIPAALNHKVGFKFDYGYIIPAITGSEGLDDSRAFSAEYRAEVKYFPKSHLDNWWYISGETFFIDNNMTKKNQAFRAENGFVYQYISSDVAINTGGFNVKIGKNYIYQSRITFDMYTGLGVRFIDVKHDAVGLEKNEYMFPFDFLPETSEREGFRTKYNFVLGIQLGLRL